MRILLLGATGRTGKLVIEVATKKGHEISAIVRDPEKLKEFDIRMIQGSPYEYTTVEKAIDGCSAVINTLNVSRTSDNPWASLKAPEDMISRSAYNAVQAMKKSGVRRFVALSTIGAGRSWKTLPFLLRFIVSISNLKYAFRDHGKQEEILENSDIDYTICRAPMLSSKIMEGEAISTPEEIIPAGKTLSRKSAAEFFIKIIENNELIGQTVSLANKPQN